MSQIGARFKVETSEIKKVHPSFCLSCTLRPSRSPKATSQSISSLIDRDYLRRAEGQQNVFEYVA